MASRSIPQQKINNLKFHENGTRRARGRTGGDSEEEVSQAEVGVRGGGRKRIEDEDEGGDAAPWTQPRSAQRKHDTP